MLTGELMKPQKGFIQPAGSGQPVSSCLTLALKTFCKNAVNTWSVHEGRAEKALARQGRRTQLIPRAAIN